MTCTPGPGLAALPLIHDSYLSIRHPVLTFYVDLPASFTIPGRSCGFDLAYCHSWLVNEYSKMVFKRVTNNLASLVFQTEKGRREGDELLDSSAS